MTEMIHDTRVVPLDGRPHIDEDIGQWSGDSKGYWDDDTLVVVTRNFQWADSEFQRLWHLKDKVLTERFTRVDRTR